MRRALGMLLVAAAFGCSTSHPATGAAPAIPTSQGSPGAATPALAMTTFMAAVKVEDLDQFSLIWGSEKGPARDIVPSDQLRKRELIMQCYLQHDTWETLSDVEQTSSLHVVSFSVTKGAISRSSKTQVVKGPGGRWFVNNTELEPLRDICSGVSSIK